MNLHSSWSTKNGIYLLQILADAWKGLEIECAKAENTETGGIIIGYYSDDSTTAVITEFSQPPKDSILRSHWFVRGVNGLRDLLINRWNHPTKQTYYIGEWHYHPVPFVTPSETDFQEMKSISRLHKYRCKEPIMVIVGKMTGEARPLRIFVFPNKNPMFEYSHTPMKGTS